MTVAPVAGPFSGAEGDEAVSTTSSSGHYVQFYEDDEFLYEIVADFLEVGMLAGEPAIVIATESHRAGFSRALELRKVDIEGAHASGQLTMLDAHATLSLFMRDGMPDRSLFRSAIGPVIEAGRRSGERIRAYGEMVDVLWRAGNPQAALRLEGLWNELGQAQSFSLLCAYVMGNFYKASDQADVVRICDAHAHVLPAETYRPTADDGERGRQIALLQQRARALENEVDQRRQLEAALRESQRELNQQNDELARAVRLCEMFVGVLGHDLRNPLSAIMTGARLLTNRADSDKIASPARRILSSAGRMARMIDQLLDFTRIRQGQGIPLRRSRVDLARICELALDELEQPSAERRARVEQLGDTAGDWDGDRLIQLVSNIVGNAFVHGSKGTPVAVRIDGSKPVVRLEVRNAGAVPPDLLPVLFQPLQLAGGEQRSAAQGLGLGLFISQQIAAAHGGAIDVASSDADGTRVTLTLPRGG